MCNLSKHSLNVRITLQKEFSDSFVPWTYEHKRDLHHKTYETASVLRNFRVKYYLGVYISYITTFFYTWKHLGMVSFTANFETK